jgi:hypothetical protein
MYLLGKNLLFPLERDGRYQPMRFGDNMEREDKR